MTASSEPDRLRFQCPRCGKKFKTDPRAAGRPTTCSKCGERFTIPAAPRPAPPPHPRPILDEEFEPIQFRGTGAVDDELDLTPMVDVTFQLLIFFMLTMALGLQKSIEVPVPSQNDAPAAAKTLEDFEEDEDFIIVRIDADDTIWVEDSEATRMEVVPKLRSLREELQKPGAPPPNSLLVMASGEARHETVVAVLDAGTEVGMQNVRLSSLEEDEL